MERTQALIKVQSDLKNLQNCNLTQQEKEVIVCSYCKKIAQSSDEEIKNLLKYLFTLVGLKDYPNKLEISVLVESMRKTLSNHTLEDIKNAFFLAIQQDIEFDLKLYDRSFNIVWLTQLMNVYDEHRRNINAKYNKMLEEQKEQEIKPSPEEIKRLNYESVKKGCIDLFNQVKAGKDISLRDVDYSGARYEFMKSLKLFEIDDKIIEDFKKLAISKVTKESVNERKKGVFDSVINPETQQGKIIRYVHNNEILYYFKLVLSTGRNLSELIIEAEKQ